MLPGTSVCPALVLFGLNRPDWTFMLGHRTSAERNTGEYIFGFYDLTVFGLVPHLFLMLENFF